ncbi:hypothetical protein TNCV_3910231 [Trichonephila clavipes]|nr:hypothetical protein TNCV_3910231 [Trichonephila clavipes]
MVYPVEEFSRAMLVVHKLFERHSSILDGICGNCAGQFNGKPTGGDRTKLNAAVSRSSYNLKELENAIHRIWSQIPHTTYHTVHGQRN